MTAGHYLPQQGAGAVHQLQGVEYSSAHGAYFASYAEEGNPQGERRNIGLYGRCLPIRVYFDSARREGVRV